MKKSYMIILFSILLITSFSVFVYSYSGAKTVCLLANPVPNIDGVISENEWGEGLYLDKSVTLKGEKNYNGFGNCYKPEFIKDAKDCSGTLYYLWDSSALYLAAKITDDDLHFKGGSPWQNDCTEWRFNPDGKSDNIYIGLWITPKFPDKPGWMLNNENSGLSNKVEELPSLKATIKKDGYEWEIKIPANSPAIKGIDLKVKNIMGFTVSIGENDSGGAEYSMPCWSLNPVTWGWNEEFWGEIEFSSKPVAVEKAWKLTTNWGYIKTNNYRGN